MASARKKQDEKNLKILRELVSLPVNKFCFDCNQRGPTYVNVTIGSFVCTKCSGMLRGLTPPHRVKSISMATFTTEEVELVKQKGNDYCRQTWLGLYEQKQSQTTKDDQEIKDFMIDKYERKRFYLDPSIALRNGNIQSTVPQKPPVQEVKPLRSILTNGQSQKDLQIKNSFSKTNGTISANNGSDFVADFNNADIFSATQFNNNNNNTNGTQTTQASFANFDNNPIFNASTYNTLESNPYNNSYENQYSSYENQYDSYLNQMSQLSRYFPNIYMPPTTAFQNAVKSVPSNVKIPPPPLEDKYAALKDLDNALKQQQEPQIDWNNGSNGSSFTSSPQSSSLYGSPSSTGNGFGSPTQGPFMPFQQEPTNISNPFQRVQNSSPWGASNGNQPTAAPNNYQSFGANPFRTDNFNGMTKFPNGMTNGFNGNQNGFNGNQINNQPLQQNMFPSSQPINFTSNKTWNTPNPFAVGVTPANGTHSNNPFL